RNNIDLAAFAHHGHAMSAVAQCAQPGDMIGVQVGINGLDQPEVELVHELEVAIHLLQHGINDQRLASAPAGQEVRIGSRDAIEELAEDHRPASSIWGFRIPSRCCGQYKYAKPSPEGVGDLRYS